MKLPNHYTNNTSGLFKIGFYTLSNERVKQVNPNSPFWRCEIILTDACNFKCPYCRGVDKEHQGNMAYLEAKRVVDYWADSGLKNVRFSGGEPTVWNNLLELVKHTKSRNVERIALSTNGSASLEYYKELIDAGVNDLSISLDACCASTGDMMAGNIEGSWQIVVDNIKELSKLTYVTVGVVLTEDNIDEFNEIIEFSAHELGVSDIRVISAAQWNEDFAQKVKSLMVDEEILKYNPILKYRLENFKKGRNVRGLKETDSKRCGLVIDDMAVLKGDHYPCIIYLREGGAPIGKVTENTRKERIDWFNRTNTHKNPICKKNCLDVCIDYNNKFEELNEFWVKSSIAKT
jgi:molybdenum cofactor biosynthesis enzyme MoaA